MKIRKSELSFSMFKKLWFHLIFIHKYYFEFMCHTVKHNLLIMMNAFIKNIYAHMLVIIIPLKRKPSQNHLTINGCRYNRNQICSNHKVVFLYYKWNHIFKIEIRVSKKKKVHFQTICS